MPRAIDVDVTVERRRREGVSDALPHCPPMGCVLLVRIRVVFRALLRLGDHLVPLFACPVGLVPEDGTPDGVVVVRQDGQRLSRAAAPCRRLFGSLSSARPASIATAASSSCSWHEFLWVLVPR